MRASNKYDTIYLGFNGNGIQCVMGVYSGSRLDIRPGLKQILEYSNETQATLAPCSTVLCTFLDPYRSIWSIDLKYIILIIHQPITPIYQHFSIGFGISALVWLCA